MKIDALSGPYFSNDIHSTQGQFASVDASLPSLYDKDTPIEALILMLYMLHEEYQALYNIQTQQIMQKLADKFDIQHTRSLKLIEASIDKQFNLVAHKETAALGNMIKKSLVAVMSTVVAASAASLGGSFLPIVTATTALFSAADAAISIVSYAQTWQGIRPDQTLGPQINRIFENILTPYSGNAYPTFTNYLDNMRTLLIAATLVSTNALFSPAAVAATFGNLVNLGYNVHNICQGLEGLYDYQVGKTQSQLAHIQADQKELQQWQNLLKEQLSMVQKGLVKQHKLSEDVISSASDALQQHFSTLQYVNRNII